ncbi:hypothetical protein PPACK8108_LOCUS25277 [Phakopsora pachyrhizi]|uniref:Uncharacterized protein n=1 Tax=Phakopsora pachyrhizi TaxID=170000 RepID=A0AAV0BTS2_PHAPC|nr:hypothetical protein PPACK8108_LOCUS25277 [Phakopsora pachyrhizi]
MGAWVESCRTMISEAYCRIHHWIDIGELFKRLGMDGEEVSLVYQTVIERTKRISALLQEQSYKLHTITLSHQDDFKKKKDEGESYRNSNISGRESKKKTKRNDFLKKKNSQLDGHGHQQEDRGVISLILKEMLNERDKRGTKGLQNNSV